MKLINDFVWYFQIKRKNLTSNNIRHGFFEKNITND